MASLNLTNTINSLNNATNTLTSNSNPASAGFLGQPGPMADGTGLPSSKVPAYQVGQFVRNIIHFFVPDFGTVAMYINPQNINYRYKKLITKERTKGGYVLQYWGNELGVLTISGTTGSAGWEGINVLYEIYQAEQLSFDAVGVSLAANNAGMGAANTIISGIGNVVGNAIGGAASGGNAFAGSVGGLLGAGVAQGVFGNDNFTNLAPRNIPTLAQNAFSTEIYYSGLIYRGYFEDMTIVESASNLGTIEYTINFMVTQQRGYRYNSMPWARSADSGPSNNDSNGGIPLSFSTLAPTNQ